MLFLIPPSETKAVGGVSLTLEQVALTFSTMNSARDEVARRLAEASADEAWAARALKLSAKQLADRELNYGIYTAPLMPAIDRYTGVLFDALHGRGLKGSGTETNRLNPEQLAIAKQTVLIQSSLFGLISASDLIPNYRFSASAKLPGLNLQQHWAAAHELMWHRIEHETLIDLRSKAYAALAPIPERIHSFEVDVWLVREDGTREQLNHFNKKAKGQFVRACIDLQLSEADNSQLDADWLAKAAAAAGLGFEIAGNRISLLANAL